MLRCALRPQLSPLRRGGFTLLVGLEAADLGLRGAVDLPPTGGPLRDETAWGCPPTLRANCLPPGPSSTQVGGTAQHGAPQRPQPTPPQRCGREASRREYATCHPRIAPGCAPGGERGHGGRRPGKSNGRTGRWSPPPVLPPGGTPLVPDRDATASAWTKPTTAPTLRSHATSTSLRVVGSASAHATLTDFGGAYTMS